MDQPNKELQQLSQVFASLGAADAEPLARSQLEQKIPQLAVYLFLKSAIEFINMLCDGRSLREIVRRSGMPGAIEALNRILGNEQSPIDLLTVVRAALSEHLIHISFVLDDTAACRSHGQPFAELLEKIHWELFQVDGFGKPVASMTGLHEVVGDILSEQMVPPKMTSTE
jgi:hypothetical protein